MRIKKTTETTPISSETVNTFSNSTKNAYSCDYTNTQLDNKQNSEWTQLTANGTTVITLPSDYNEFIVIVRVQDNGIWNVGTFTKSHITPMGINYYRNGHYTSSADNSDCTTKITPTTVNVQDVHLNTIDKTSNAVLYVYYR